MTKNVFKGAYEVISSISNKRLQHKFRITNDENGTTLTNSKDILNVRKQYCKKTYESTDQALVIR